MMSERVHIAVTDGVADVQLARPDKINALDRAAFEAIVEAIATIGADDTIRCVVLSGQGRGFCVGVDLESLSGDAALRDLAPRTHGHANLFQQAAWGWRELPVPVIAAVHGFAFGAGLQIMLGADIRIATPDAKLSMMEARWGLAPDVAGIALLRGLVRNDVARDIVFTARIIAGEEAASLGLVTRLAADPHAEAVALAHRIAAVSPAAIKAAKRLLNLAADGDTAAILLAESVEQQILMATPEHLAAVAAGHVKARRA